MGCRTVEVDCTFRRSVRRFKYKARFPFKRNRLRWQSANHGCHCFDRAFLLAGVCVCCVKFSRNKLKRQPIGMLGRSSGNHHWLLANASEWKPGFSHSKLLCRQCVSVRVNIVSTKQGHCN